MVPEVPCNLSLANTASYCWRTCLPRVHWPTATTQPSGLVSAAKSAPPASNAKHKIVRLRGIGWFCFIDSKDSITALNSRHHECRPVRGMRELLPHSQDARADEVPASHVLGCGNFFRTA